MIIIINIIYNCRSLIVTYRKSAKGGRGGERKKRKKGEEERKRNELFRDDSRNFRLGGNIIYIIVLSTFYYRQKSRTRILIF